MGLVWRWVEYDGRNWCGVGVVGWSGVGSSGVVWCGVEYDGVLVGRGGVGVSGEAWGEAGCSRGEWDGVGWVRVGWCGVAWGRVGWYGVGWGCPQGVWASRVGLRSLVVLAHRTVPLPMPATTPQTILGALSAQTTYFVPASLGVGVGVRKGYT